MCFATPDVAMQISFATPDVATQISFATPDVAMQTSFATPDVAMQISTKGKEFLWTTAAGQREGVIRDLLPLRKGCARSCEKDVYIEALLFAVRI